MFEEIKADQFPHATCLLLIDTSSSMSGESINSVNEGIRIFIEQLNNDPIARDTVDIAVVSFNSTVQVIEDFKPASSFTSIPTLTASGATSMGAGLDKAIDMVLDRKHLHEVSGVDSHIPWIVMFTDGAPTDSVDYAKQRLDAENAKSESGRGRIQLWALAVQGADVGVLNSLTKRVLYVVEKDYTKIFDWTRKSLAIVSASKVGEVPNLPNFEGTGAQTNLPDGWA